MLGFSIDGLLKLLCHWWSLSNKLCQNNSYNAFMSIKRFSNEKPRRRSLSITWDASTNWSQSFVSENSSANIAIKGGILDKLEKWQTTHPLTPSSSEATLRNRLVKSFKYFVKTHDLGRQKDFVSSLNDSLLRLQFEASKSSESTHHCGQDMRFLNA